MTAAAHQPAPSHTVAWIGWLPRLGLSNGLGADAWAPILVVDRSIARPLLDAFAAAGVPAYAAPERSGARRRGRQPAAGPCRVWVATGRYAHAEQVLLSVMPGLLAEVPGGLR